MKCSKFAFLPRENHRMFEDLTRYAYLSKRRHSLDLISRIYGHILILCICTVHEEHHTHDLWIINTLKYSKNFSHSHSQSLVALDIQIVTPIVLFKPNLRCIRMLAILELLHRTENSIRSFHNRLYPSLCLAHHLFLSLSLPPPSPSLHACLECGCTVCILCIYASKLHNAYHQKIAWMILVAFEQSFHGNSTTRSYESKLYRYNFNWLLCPYFQILYVYSSM